MTNSYIQTMLGEHEEILMASRQHWLVLMRSILLEIMLILTIFALVTILVPFLPQAVLANGLVILPIFGMFRDVLLWWNRQYIVTSQRALQIAGIFQKGAIDTEFAKIIEIKLEQTTLGRLFDYGNLEILTTAELGAILFQHVDEPVRFKTTIYTAKERLKEAQPALEEPGIRPNEIPGLIAQLDQLRLKGILSEEEFQQKKQELLERV